MPEDKKPEKDSKEEKEKSKYGLSKETLERILEDKKPKKEVKPIIETEENTSRVSEEELKMLSQTKNKTKNEEETTTKNQQRKPIFLERELSGEFPSETGNNSEKDSNSFEYIPKGSQEESENKYVSYETDLSKTKFRKSEDISKSWSKPFEIKNSFQEIHSENINNPDKNRQKYETYFTPKKIPEDKNNEEFHTSQLNKSKMHYGSNH